MTLVGLLERMTAVAVSKRLDAAHEHETWHACAQRSLRDVQRSVDVDLAKGGERVDSIVVHHVNACGEMNDCGAAREGIGCRHAQRIKGSCRDARLAHSVRAYYAHNLEVLVEQQTAQRPADKAVGPGDRDVC